MRRLLAALIAAVLYVLGIWIAMQCPFGLREILLGALIAHAVVYTLILGVL